MARKKASPTICAETGNRVSNAPTRAADTLPRYRAKRLGVALRPGGTVACRSRRAEAKRASVSACMVASGGTEPHGARQDGVGAPGLGVKGRPFRHVIVPFDDRRPPTRASDHALIERPDRVGDRTVMGIDQE